MKRQLQILIASLAICGITSMHASETSTIQLKKGSITNKSNELINIFLFKTHAAAANILLAHGWSQRSLTLLANTTKIAQNFVQEAAIVNLGIGFLSDFATDVIASIVAAVGTKGQFLCVSKSTTIWWNKEELKTKTKDPNLESIFCIIFATQPDWTTNFKRILFMGDLDISTNYEFHLGKIINRDTGQVENEFAPIEQTISGTVKKLTDISAEDVATQLKKILKERQERQEEAARKARQEAERLEAEKHIKELQEQVELRASQLGVGASSAQQGQMPSVPTTSQKQKEPEEQ